MKTAKFVIQSFMELPQSYVIDKFYSFSYNVRETTNYLNGCCPICSEGSSWGKKTRLFYFKKDDYLYCHNCFRSWTPYFWVKEATGLTFKEIIKELKGYVHDFKYQLVLDKQEETSFELPSLPGECVNLKDELQLKYFSKYDIIQKAKKYCEQRRLFSAINSPKTLYCCLNDKFHGNRLIIPYYDNNSKITCYTSRALLDNDTKGKYLLKFGSKKPLFNSCKIDENYPYIFLFEGQIDSMFLKNGVSISGTKLTTEQEYILTSEFPFHNKIWILDNFRFEKKQVIEIIKEKLQKNETVFLYDNEFSEFKDLNEYCIKKEQDFVDPALILKSCYSGQKGLVKLGD